MNTAQQVKDMADSLCEVNNHLCACVGFGELLPAQERAEKKIKSAYGMKCRSKQANELLQKAIGYATQALARSQVSSEFKRQRAHLN